jgi:hypothetical protein
VPYTYTDMQRNVKTILQGNEAFVRAEILCNTLAGMPVPLLTITDNLSSCLSYSDQLALIDLPSMVKKQFKQKHS